MHVKSVRVSYSPQCQQKVSKKCHLIQVALLIYSFDLFIKAANNQAFSIYKGLAYYLLRPCMCKPNRCSAEMSFLWPCCLFCWKETNKLKKVSLCSRWGALQWKTCSSCSQTSHFSIMVQWVTVSFEREWSAKDNICQHTVSPHWV